MNKSVQQEIAPCNDNTLAKKSFQHYLFSEKYLSMTSTKKIAYLALLLAFSYVCNVFAIPILATNQISLIFIPIFITAIYLGIIPTICIATLGDILQAITVPKGAFNPLITLSSLVAGLIAGVLFTLFNKGKRDDALLLCSILILIISQLLINTTAVYLYLIGLEQIPQSASNGWYAYLLARLPWCSLTAFTNYVIMIIILRSNVLERVFGR